MLASPYENAWQPGPCLDCVDPVRALEQDGEDDPRFQSGQRGPYAEVRAPTERKVSLRRSAVQSKLVGIVELRRIPVGCAPQEQEMGVRGKRDSAQRGVTP